jgi:DNA-binding transcriptional ArsR family regulator
MDASHRPRHASLQEAGVSRVSELREPINRNREIHPAKGNTCRLPPHLDWLARAARLPGKFMHLAVALQLIATEQQNVRVELSNLACESFGLNRNAKYRALFSLEGAGLIIVKRKRGRSPLVTILDGIVTP